MLLFVAIAGLLVAGYFIASALKPLVQPGVVTAEDWERIQDESSELVTRRDRLVEELRELELDASLHRLSDGDLADLRARYEAEAVDVVRKLDEGVERYQQRIERALGGQGGEAGTAEPTGAEKAAIVGKKAAQPEPEAKARPAAQPEPEAKARPAAQPEPAAKVEPEVKAEPQAKVAPAACASCGTALAPDAAFCDGCGTPRHGSTCGACGAANRAGARFCKACGGALAVQESA